MKKPEKDRRMRLGFGRYAPAVAGSPLRKLIRSASETLARRATEDANAIDGPSVLEGLMDPESLKKRRMLLFGAGAMGNRNAELMAPYINHWDIFDCDIVEPRNTQHGRTLYTKEDWGQPKVYAEARRLKAINSDIQVTAHYRDINDISESELSGWGERSDAALVAVDDGYAIFRLNRALYPHLPVYYQGIHQQGRSGQIIVTRPGSPCLCCCLGTRSPDDVETLHREPALGLHFGAVAQLTVQLVVQQLATQHNTQLGSPLSPKVSVIFLSNTAGEMSRFGPGITLMEVRRDPDCETCGSFHSKGGEFGL